MSAPDGGARSSSRICASSRWISSVMRRASSTRAATAGSRGSSDLSAVASWKLQRERLLLDRVVQLAREPLAFLERGEARTRADQRAQFRRHAIELAREASRARRASGRRSRA
jgi:hypothetical protein